jgi:hypothetical protein
MRKSAFIVFCLAFTLNACTTTTPSRPQQARNSIKHGETLVSYVTPLHKAKRGNEVAFYSHESSIKRPYRIIGKETVSRYNFIGIKRHSHRVDELMKNLAAAMGGDAIINISSDQQKVEGTVISFEKVLL